MMTALYSMLAAVCLWLADCISPGASADRRDSEPELTKWSADSDAYWTHMQAKEDARNAELDHRAEVKRREGIYGAIDEYRAAHHESPRTTGDVKQWGDREVIRDAVKRDARQRSWIMTMADGSEVAVQPRLDDEDKENEEAGRYR
jgi:hypothetical protein